LGPLIRAEVGGTIKVVLKNKTAIMCSMHPHGLHTPKIPEGGKRLVNPNGGMAREAGYWMDEQ
jgi:FtsP/CotA-like multicopper oxidase with cupredoxin domain